MTNALFPFLMEPLGTGGSISEVVGGFIEGSVQPSLSAVVGTDPVNRTVVRVGVTGAVQQSFTARVTQTIVATIQPNPIVAELNDGG